MTVRCPVCGSTESRVVSVDIPWPDGTYANEYRCVQSGHVFIASQADIEQGPGGPGR